MIEVKFGFRIIVRIILAISNLDLKRLIFDQILKLVIVLKFRSKSSFKTQSTNNANENYKVNFDFKTIARIILASSYRDLKRLVFDYTLKLVTALEFGSKSSFITQSTNNADENYKGSTTLNP